MAARQSDTVQIVAFSGDKITHSINCPQKKSVLEIKYKKK